MATTTPIGTLSEAVSAAPTPQDEGVLRDVLLELDRERSKRAELEAQFRMLSEDQAIMKDRMVTTREPAISRKAFLSVTAQVESYQQLVDALTQRNPAVAAASKSSIPLHVIRLLEVVPWDPSAHEHIYGSEELYEWQVFDANEERWQSNLRFFPVLFKSLPVIKPRASGDIVHEKLLTNKDNPLLLFLAGGDKGVSAPSKHGTLTDDRLTQLYNIEAGYPLPQGRGSWEWIGGWRIDKRLSIAGDGKIDCDEDGWSYAREAQHFLLDPTELVWDHHSPTDDTDAPTRRVRRRKWTRRRILVDYPFASERTKQYLKLLAENARLSVTVDKVSDQLVETKTALTETEEELMQTKAELVKREGLLKVVGADRVTESRSQNGDARTNPLQDFLPKNEQVKEIGSKISQWVQSARKPNDDVIAPEADPERSFENNPEEAVAKFDWKMIGRGALLERIKQTQTSPQYLQLARSMDTGVSFLQKDLPGSTPDNGESG